jgi:anti-sigma factor ChrR (cupin superfamily)
MSEPFCLEGLLQGGWRDASFEPFREGVEICRLHVGTPEIALLRYAPGASVPAHRHVDLETILVLDGAQQDERGRYPVGSFVVNTPGGIHSVSAPEGCVVLVQWTAPVAFL